MKLKDMIPMYIGDTLISIIQIEINKKNRDVVKDIIGDLQGGLNTLNVMLFKNNKGLAFISLDDDGYRDGDWYLTQLKRLLDKENTTTLKILNETVKAIEYVKNCQCLIITLENHLIKMGQDQSDSYYPINFFDVEDCRDFALDEIIEMEE